MHFVLKYKMILSCKSLDVITILIAPSPILLIYFVPLFLVVGIA